MKSTVALLATLLIAQLATADLVTFKNGTTTTGTVLHVTDTTVAVESELGRQDLKRSAVRSIEFGDVLVTGITDNVFISKEFRARFAAPEGWAMYKEPGLDFAGKKGAWVALARSLPLEGITDGGESLLTGALAGMMANIPGATSGELRPVRWGGQKATRVDVTSPQLNLAVCFLHLESTVVLFAVGTQPEGFAGHPEILAAWEQGFELIPW